MLKTVKSTNLNGQSVVGEQIVRTFYASVTSEGNTTSNSSTVNRDLYIQNYEQVKADEDEFEAKVREIETEVFEKLATESEEE